MRAPTLLLLALFACKGDGGFVTYDAEPSVSITQPNDGTTVNAGVLVEFGAAVSDDQPGVMLTWSSDLDGTLAEETTDERSAVLSIASLSPGVHTITLTAVDSAAQDASDSVSIEVIQVPEEPLIAVVHPASGESGVEDVPFALQVQVADEQDDSIAMRVVFSSSLDGSLCTDVIPDLTGVATCSFVPAAGNHTLDFVVTDTDGLTASATAVLAVTSSLDVDNDNDGFTENQGDCNDANPAVNPNAPEFYNGVDDDCDGLIDNNTDGYDDDGDGFTELTGDCNDADPLINPNATEFADGVDNDCDGLIDNNTDDFDDDGDGFSEASGDCDDNNININPNAADIPYNGVDEDCSGSDNNDVDGDGHAADFVLGGDDCDDNNPSINPSATDNPYNGVDEDCSGADLTDVDEDGFDSDTVLGGTDCDDLDPDINPDAIDVPYDGIDQDCIGGDLTDADGDGQTAASIGGQDCNDNDPNIFAGATEVPYDGIDQDCDGTDLTDVDGDGYVGVSVGGNDCDDNNNAVNPGATEVPYNSIDDDCTNGDLTDVDGDGFDGPSTTGPDCNDTLSAVNPAATEIPYNGVDEDCSGADLRDVDGDGFEGQPVGGPDCNDNDSQIRPNATETCDGIDNNCTNGVDEDNASGCTVYYADADGDNYGNSTGDSRCLCNTQGIYDVTNANDCYDQNSSARPGQTAYFTSHRGDGSFDYNCDGSPSKRYNNSFSCSCAFCFDGCDPVPGWTGTNPACGQSADYADLCVPLTCSDFQADALTQECR